MIFFSHREERLSTSLVVELRESLTTQFKCSPNTCEMHNCTGPGQWVKNCLQKKKKPAWVWVWGAAQPHCLQELVETLWVTATERFLAQPKYFLFQSLWQTNKDLQQVPYLSNGLGWDQEGTFLPCAPLHLDQMCCSYQNDEGNKILMGKSLWITEIYTDFWSS